jgi:hypothetical protein
LYYVYGKLEQNNKHFMQLNPELLKGYHSECELFEVSTLFGEEITHLAKDFEICSCYTEYLDVEMDPRAKPVQTVPVSSGDAGLVIYEVKDFPTWHRRKLSNDEDWRVLDKFYHHVIVESASSRTTTVVFHRFHAKPKEEALDEDGTFMEDDTPEPDQSEI